jgi:hypothetical protein
MITIYRGSTMNIIFGKEQADILEEKYIVLELDTFQIGTDGPVVTAYCTVETFPLESLTSIDQLKQTHKLLISNYQSKNWAQCLDVIQQLQGNWNGELDSFYTELKNRADQYLGVDPGPDWTPVILKS